MRRILAVSLLVLFFPVSVFAEVTVLSRTEHVVPPEVFLDESLKQALSLLIAVELLDQAMEHPCMVRATAEERLLVIDIRSVEPKDAGAVAFEMITQGDCRPQTQF